MPRKLKTYQTSQGFYDLAIAAPSMKVALEAWGASSNLFHQGFAKESEDSKVIAAAMAKPGIVLRRPVGSDSAFSFSEHSDLPSAASLDAPRRLRKAKPDKAKSAKGPKIDENAERRAAAAYEKERERRDRQRQKEEAAAARAQAEREVAVSKAEAALETAEQEHKAITAKIEKSRAAVDLRAKAEKTRWDKLKERLQTALRKAGE